MSYMMESDADGDGRINKGVGVSDMIDEVDAMRRMRASKFVVAWVGQDRYELLTPSDGKLVLDKNEIDALWLALCPNVTYVVRLQWCREMRSGADAPKADAAPAPTPTPTPAPALRPCDPELCAAYDAWWDATECERLAFVDGWMARVRKANEGVE